MARTDKVAIFCSYSHRDEDLRDELFRHLELLKQSGIIQAWYDGEIAAGQEWREEIESALRSADVVLLLVSIDLLTSDYVRNHEMPIALERWRAGEALIVPVLLRPVSWALSGLDALQALPDGLKPVVSWRPRDRAYVAISEGLVAAILAWRGRGAESAPVQARVTSERVLDVGLPRRVPVRLTTVLAVMVRRPESDGLAGLMDLEQRYGLTPEEVESSGGFAVEFPRGSQEALEFGVRIESADFDCSTTSKELRVPPDRDSDVCVFLLTARRTGSLVVNVELTYEGRRMAGCLLRSEGVTAAVYEPAVQASVRLRMGAPTGMRITSMPAAAAPVPQSAREPESVTFSAPADGHGWGFGRLRAAGAIAAGVLVVAVGASLYTRTRETAPRASPAVTGAAAPECRMVDGTVLSCGGEADGVAEVVVRRGDEVVARRRVAVKAGRRWQVDLRHLVGAGAYTLEVSVPGAAVYRASFAIE